MTQHDSDVNRQNSKSDLSRARQRKMKREDGKGVGPQAVAGVSQTRHTRQRASSRIGPSVRERLVPSHVNIPNQKLRSIQSKVSLTLNRVSHMPDPGEVTRKTINGIGRIERILSVSLRTNARKAFMNQP